MDQVNEKKLREAAASLDVILKRLDQHIGVGVADGGPMPGLHVYLPNKLNLKSLELESGWGGFQVYVHVIGPLRLGKGE